VSRFSVTDKLFFQHLVAKRGHICEIHKRECPGIGPMHILSKASAPRLRYDDFNVVLACWFGAHYPTHQNPDDTRAIFARQRICELRGYETWEVLRFELQIRARTAPKVDLKMLNLCFREELHV
jgi:hypothetical protein